MLLIWKANVDIQFVHEKSLVLNRYISSYITKFEKNETHSIWEICNKKKSLQGALKSFAIQSLKKREIGAFEISDKLLGHSLYCKSAAIKWLGKEF